ncbi:MAG TPA: aminotransferase class V-fold PLP-dependent enzyme [Alphaproteobacteria bacterium]|nr:aminotransferase class V-fold PLP-dependent enzyme [Alphaproteobacteria bacterium]
MTIDLARARRETPGTAEVIHLNNAGAALMPRPVIKALVDHIELESRIGGYEAAERESARIEHAYDALARLLNCRRDEIAVVENATRAWDMGFYALSFRPGDRILTAVAEYASNVISFLQVAQRTGATLEVVPNDEAGQLSLAALERLMDERVRLIAVTHVPTNGGLVNPAAAIGGVAKAWGVPFLLDACQSAGQMPLDVEAIGCDMLSATGRKFLRGPRGIGFLYVRKSLLERLEPPFLDLHAARWTDARHYELRPDARRFENWETNVAAKLALAAAVDYALEWGLDAIYARVRTLADFLREELARIPGVVVRDLGAERCGIVTFTVEGKSADEIKKRLALQAINVAASTASSTRFDMEARGLDALVRASVHYYNSEAELERFLAAITALARAGTRRSG